MATVSYTALDSSGYSHKFCPGSTVPTSRVFICLNPLMNKTISPDLISLQLLSMYSAYYLAFKVLKQPTLKGFPINFYLLDGR
jgi:hypothetical protein